MPRTLLGLLLAGYLCACASSGPAPQPARAQRAARADAGVLRCGRASFTIDPPAGWVATPRAAESHGMLAALHPAEQTWNSARVVMLVRCDPGATDPHGLIARDKERFARRSKLVVVGEADPIRIAEGEPLELRTFSGGPDGRNEAVAYMQVQGGVVRLILRAASQHSFEVHLPAFEALLGSLRRAD